MSSHRVVLGMAAGVGKTFRALQELRAAADAGRDAVVAYLEPHGRSATVAEAQGLELLARRTVSRGGVALTELDLPGVLARAPELVLVDELAHTNAPGLEHAKRWQDVEALLAAGIDVLSTVNVQHLESLNDLVHEITGVRVRETVPDRVLAEADEVVVVDVSPAALLDRLRAGLVHPPDRVEAALNGFFKVEHLGALRELALRQVAEAVEARRRRDVPLGTRAGDAPDVAERLLAWVPDPAAGEPVVRRSWRSAQRLAAPLTVLVTRPVRPPEPPEQAALDALSRLCAALRVELLVREADEAVEAVVAVARELDATYVLLAPPARRRLRASPVDRLVEALPGADVRLVRDRGAVSG
ncbi:histidine kinase [Conexibacter sp. SYSU D00693]|uniref:histidine kinase n=1 Tax=Conexibacter sp. SYSU D00693 TaxID=2812560 RepID=UPI001F11D8EF|nr:histidine kinase [Conexibacter sp. SYSU D00693]